MNIGKWICESADCRNKYEYYLSLGYSDKAAQVLSAVTYGDNELVYLVSRLKKENKLEALYDWLQTREEDDPEDAVSAYYEENHPKPKFDDFERRYKICGSAGGAITPSLASEPFGEVSDDDADLEFVREEVFDEMDMFCMAPQSVVNTSAIHFRTSPMARLKKVPHLAEALATDTYESIEEKDAKNVFTAPTSTFRMTTSNASMGVVFNQLRNGRRIELDQVRIEEILNAFDYEAEIPTDAKFRISTEFLEKKDNKKILYINAQAAEEKKERQNIILLLDTSGSMWDDNETTQEAIATIFSKLNVGDSISLVTYSTEDHTWIEGYEIEGPQDKEDLMGVILGIEIDGCTDGSAGIETAYKFGKRFYIPDGNNQVILITDGDLNFGITEKGGLKDLIEEKKKSNLFLSVIGTGLYNYKDDKLETLSKHGNGTYCVVNALEDVDEFINRHYVALTNIVAKDVKAQVEFNPRFVKSYRLLGYENRELNHEDFKNDAVISEPYGSGGHGIALYELEMADGRDRTVKTDLKYQTPVLTDSDELGTVTIRYKEPLGDNSVPIEAVIYNKETPTKNAQLAYFIYCLSEKLRGSNKLNDYDEQYLDVMITSGLWKSFSGPNRDKLAMLVAAYNKRAGQEQRAEPGYYEDELSF